MWTGASLSNLATNGRKFGHIPGIRQRDKLSRGWINQLLRVQAHGSPAGQRQATQGSGADPDDPERNREAQAKRAEGSQHELREQICLGSDIRQRHGVTPWSPRKPPDEQ